MARPDQQGSAEVGDITGLELNKVRRFLFQHGDLHRCDGDSIEMSWGSRTEEMVRRVAMVGARGTSWAWRLCKELSGQIPSTHSRADRRWGKWYEERMENSINNPLDLERALHSPEIGPDCFYGPLWQSNGIIG